MSVEHEDSSTSDARLSEIIQEYLQAVDAGRAPDREEFFQRHADYAAELRAFFADQDKLDRLVQDMKPEAAQPLAAEGVP